MQSSARAIVGFVDGSVLEMTTSVSIFYMYVLKDLVHMSYSQKLAMYAVA